jgi:succinyl-diaminopimelate desuccinylase
LSVVGLARELVRLDTANPPGNEAAAAGLVAHRLAAAGATVRLHELAPGRAGLVAHLPGTAPGPTLCFSGHLDTVALGEAGWTHDPLGGELEGDRLWGRGSSDMKGAVAAMVVAFEALASAPRHRPLALVLSAAEESGCEGAAPLAESLLDLGAHVGALVVGESTCNRVALAHKGVAWLRLRARGLAAHASMPHLGRNAVMTLAHALGTLDDLAMVCHTHALLDGPTLSVGTIQGGTSTNIVPELCEATLDVRLVPSLSPEAAVAAVREALRSEVEVTLERALPAVETDSSDAWIAEARAIVASVEGEDSEPIGVPYFTDAAVLNPVLNNPPTLIVGPGNPALAHQADEWCSISAIERARTIYEQLGAAWTSDRPRKD